jgi:hypothetical protein
VVIVFATEDAEVQLHALQTVTEQFLPCEKWIVVLENCIVVGK